MNKNLLLYLVTEVLRVFVTVAFFGLAYLT